MSELQVTTVSVNNTTNATAIVAGNTVINATGIHLGSGGGVNTSAVHVEGETYVLTANMNIPSITVANVVSRGAVETVNVQIFTANGTWTKPSWATDGKELVVVHLWGGGGGGAYNTNIASGGGGGAFVFGYFIAQNCNAVCNVVVGLGGAGGVNANGSPGTRSIFYPNSTVTAALYAYGGSGGRGTSSIQGGPGGGWLSEGFFASNQGGRPLGGNSSVAQSTFGGGVGGGSGVPGGNSVYGGGGGGGVANGGFSYYGGGGGGSGSTGVSGNSIFGGSGASTESLEKNTAGIPGGGGGAAAGNNFVSAGARGEVRIYTYRIL